MPASTSACATCGRMMLPPWAMAGTSRQMESNACGDRCRARAGYVLTPAVDPNRSLVAVLLRLGAFEQHRDGRLLRNGAMAPARRYRDDVAFLERRRGCPFLL